MSTLVSTDSRERITSRFDRESSVFDVVDGLDLNGQCALVTGGGSGFGYATARALAQAGATVYVADVDIEKTRRAADAFNAEHGKARLHPLALDLASQSGVRSFASAFLAQVPALHILVNNAGIMAAPQGYTEDGIERQFAVNYLGHYVLTRLLQPALVSARGARVVSVSSIGHRRSDIRYDDIHFRHTPFNTWDAYGQSKTACALLAVEVDRRWSKHGVRSNTLNPGGSLTGLHEHLTVEERKRMGWLDEEGKSPARWRTPEQCASTATWLASAPELADVGGRYFEECQQAPAWSESDPGVGVKTYAIDPDNARRLWRVSAEMAHMGDD
ncbi:SDR family NAD(P)-dependent oxidoreductase [Hydrogenophaga sp.]|uniref:SDR family NAD(P)-dependent oxidoreductase n=1 Tax=Hydrogenophaga sp. TaxID=1904254 RepID=UPI00271E05F7|nr:SDR family NAD(P)-dependent oxidoreductase [Hydrogenophaga sp.]MDO9437114.1 SDR family NAD(P)-dependent oxidoreductase [Hydrogenophaga sp.]